MSRYLLTGCAGFIGARVAELLLDRGDEVVGVDDLNDAYDVRLKDWRLARLVSRAGFTFRRGDIRDRGFVDSLSEGSGAAFGAVVNLAARAGIRPSVTNPYVYYETNVLGTLNLLELCRAREISRFVLASSSSVYGDAKEMPFREDAPLGRPLSPYAASKRAAEDICATYHGLHGIATTALRFFTVYGPAGRPDMSPFRFTQWISEGRPLVLYGDGSQRRDFTYVDDIADATVRSLDLGGFHILNVGSDHPVPLIEAIRKLEALIGKTARIDQRPANPADAPATWADVGQAAETLHWQPKTGIDEGLGSLVRWYAENRSWAQAVMTS